MFSELATLIGFVAAVLLLVALFHAPLMLYAILSETKKIRQLLAADRK